ncbi:MAG: hypothetical protein R3336_06770, partial [Phycisphaeraceae bacterium]|nr:hypothetical protein [Phycisphaeraceae bacterium]
AMATDLGGQMARILVLTDHKPENEIDDGRIQWWSFGRSQANTGFVAATRSEDPERIMLEVANRSPETRRVPLTVEALGPTGGPSILHQASLVLPASQVKQVFVDLPEDAPALRARLEVDDLVSDNTVLLLPPSRPPVRVSLLLAAGPLRQSMDQVLGTIPFVRLTDQNPDLVITELDRSAVTARRWVLRVMIDATDPKGYVGPFVMNRSHPLVDGLDLDGVVWAAGEESPLRGDPVLTAGNVVLVSDTLTVGGSHELRMKLQPKLSTLLKTPNWPIFLWNLTEWRRLNLPGPVQTNLMAGQSLAVNLPEGTEKIVIQDPDGKTITRTVASDRLALPMNQPGRWQLSPETTRRWEVAVNLLSLNESDLSEAETGRWGDWTVVSQFRWEYRSISWIFALLALGLLLIHQALVSRASRSASNA